MKKSAKKISYLLVLALLISLLSGLGYVNKQATEIKAAGKSYSSTFNVLEIVPTSSMASFDALKDTFKTNVLVPAGFAATVTVNVNTRTPGTSGTLTSTDIQNADMIIINQTKSGVSNPDKFINNEFTTAQVLQIFKKIAGVDGNSPVPYIIDFNIYDASVFEDARLKNENLTKSDAYDQKRFGYVAADNVYALYEGDAGDSRQTFTTNGDQVPNIGTDHNSFKLYKLLSSIDPATLYGLYFGETDGSYGIDENLNLLYVKAPGASANPMSYNLGSTASAWTDDYFRPNYLSLLGSQFTSGSHNTLQTMGWHEIDTTGNGSKSDRSATIGDFCHAIGGGNGRGLVYKSSSGLSSLLVGDQTAIFVTPIPDETTNTPADTPTPTPKVYTVNVNNTKNYSVNDAASLTTLIKEQFGKDLYNIPENIEDTCKTFLNSGSYSEGVEYNINTNDKDYVVNDVESYKNFLKDMGVSNSDLASVESLPILLDWKFRNHIGETYSWDIANNKIKNLTRSLIGIWTYDNGTPTDLTDDTSIEFVASDLDAIKTFFKANAVITDTFYSTKVKNASGLESVLKDAFLLQNVNVSLNDSSSGSGNTGSGTYTVTNYSTNCGDKLAGIIKSYYVYDKNDYHPYRFLVVSEAKKTMGSINRSVIADMVGYANGKEKGLAGGIVVDCMSKYQFDDLAVNLLQTYDAIIYEDLNDAGEELLKRYSSSKTISNFDSENLINFFKTEFNSQPFGVEFISVPQEYYVNFKTKYNAMNDWGGYQPIDSSHEETGYNYTSLKVDGNLNYINNDANASKSTLDFRIGVKGATSYTVSLYVDVNGDGRFSEIAVSTDSDGKKSGEKITQASNATGVYSFDMTDFTEEGFVGGFSWKFVVTDSTGTSISKVGYSAIRNTQTDENGNIKKTRIRILQIYPTEYSSMWGQDQHNGGTKESETGRQTLPNLLLPDENIYTYTTSTGSVNKTETERAKDLNTTSITDMVISSDTSKSDLPKYFSGSMHVDVVRGNSTGGHSGIYDNIVTYPSTYPANTSITLSKDSELMRYDSASNGRKNLMTNSAIFYRFLSMLDEYEIKAYKYSVQEFSKLVADGDIKINPDTGRFTTGDISVDNSPISDTDAKRNIDGSIMYIYDTDALVGSNKIAANWRTATVSWTDGTKPKYLVYDSSKYIYGERDEADGTVKYYTASEFGSTGNRVRKASANNQKNENDFDMVVIGFGTNMDYMYPGAVGLIKKYLQDNGPALIGNGAVTLSDNNNLGNAIRNVIGMSDELNTGYDPKSDTEHEPMMVINDTLFSHYPFKVERFLKGSSGVVQPYKLSLTGKYDTSEGICTDPVVSFARYKTDLAEPYGTWGNAQEAYYLYKKGNITFCGFGSTWRIQNDKISNVMSMAETLMIVNALIATSRAGSGGTTTKPYINCIDPDRSVLNPEDNEGDSGKAYDSEGNEYHIFKDSVYTDYDSREIAAEAEAKKSVIAAAAADAVIDYAVSPIESEALKPAALDGKYEDGDENKPLRWVPYLQTLPKGQAYLEFYKSDGSTPLSVVIYGHKYVTGTDGKIAKVFGKLTAETGTVNKFEVVPNGTYYIGIPYEYNSTTGLGFRMTNKAANNIDQFAIKFRLIEKSNSKETTIEEHVLAMIRRVLYLDK